MDTYREVYRDYLEVEPYPLGTLDVDIASWFPTKDRRQTLEIS
jgi:hypothetical protein